MLDMVFHGFGVLCIPKRSIAPQSTYVSFRDGGQSKIIFYVPSLVTIASTL